MGSTKEKTIKNFYWAAPLAAAIATGAISSIPWLYDRFIIQEHKLVFTVETPIPMQIEGFDSFVQVVALSNAGRNPLSEIVVNFPAETRSIALSDVEAIPASIERSILGVTSLLPGEKIRATIVSENENLIEKISVRSKEVAGEHSTPSASRNQIVPTILFAAGGALLAATAAMLWLRRRRTDYINQDDPNLILLVSAIFHQKYLMELVWDVRYYMKYRGAAEFVLMEALRGQVDEMDVKALIALSIDPAQNKRDRYEIAYYIARVTGKDVANVLAIIQEKLVAKSSSREDLFSAVWLIRDSTVESLL